MLTSAIAPHGCRVILLWCIWALLLAGGLIASVGANASLSSLETELKVASSLVLVACGWLALTTVVSAMRPITRLIAVGMTLGFLGDASPLLGSLWPVPQRTLGNMLLFGLGHVAYIRACVLVRRADHNRCDTARWCGSFAVWLAIGAVLWYFAAYTGTQHPEMRFPALAYTLLLSATVGAAVGCALSNRSFVPVAAGAILFLISDLLLAVWIFRDPVQPSFDLVWLCYGVGQMLIVFGSSRFVRTVNSSPM
jgi:hypothetical protein